MEEFYSPLEHQPKEQFKAYTFNDSDGWVSHDFGRGMPTLETPSKESLVSSLDTGSPMSNHENVHCASLPQNPDEYISGEAV